MVDNDSKDTIEVDDNKEGLLYTAREVEEGITIKEEDENEMTTNLEVELEDRFDPNLESNFDDAIDSDKDIDDENM
jgi:hypothetical protein